MAGHGERPQSTAQAQKPRHRPRRGCGRRGQLAVGFLVIMAFVLSVVSMTINLGQMATARVETSNAADAAALAGASWIASGQNEAAHIARRMSDAIQITSELYWVPLCPVPKGQPNTIKEYVDEVWLALAAGDAKASIQDYGINHYLQDAADAAMLGGYMVGHREFLTATMNNMVTKHRTVFVKCDPKDPGCSADGFDPYGDLMEQIRVRQQQAYQQGRTEQDICKELRWNNGVPLDSDSLDAIRLTHLAHCVPDFPATPPSLVTKDVRWGYFQYNRYEKDGECAEPMKGWGLKTTLGGSGAEYPSLRRLNDFPENPLKVREDGRKGWEFPLANFGKTVGAIPSMDELEVGQCEVDVCGWTKWRTPSVQIAPSTIQQATGIVTARTSHEVKAQAKPQGKWEPKFPTVEARAQARFTAASVDPPAAAATAQLESTQ